MPCKRSETFMQCTAMVRKRFTHSAMHRNAPQWSARLPQRFCNAPRSVCLSDAVWDGGWVGPGIGTLNFGGNHRREGAVLGKGKFGTFRCNQWDCLYEGR